MGHHSSKMQGLVLPCQGGKTRKAINIINKRYMEIAEVARASGVVSSDSDLNIWISANNKMLVKQTETRMSAEIQFEDSESDSDDELNADAIIDDENRVFSWMSGTKKNNITTDSVTLAILLNKIEMIVMCSNGIRMRYLNTLLRQLSEFPMFTKKITIWIDEADVSLCSWRKYPNVLAMKQLNQVILITATPTPIIKMYTSLQIIPYACTYPEVYRYLTHAECVEVTWASSDIRVNLMDIILAEGNDALYKPGARAFIPGNFDKNSHEEVSTVLMEMGFIVIILNGTEKEIRFPDEEKKVIDLKPFMTTHGTETPEEFNETLARLYSEHHMARYPLAITGCLCVERGITFQSDVSEDHSGFVFDYGIIPPVPNAATAYQTMARLFGNIGHFSNYKPCTIYADKKTFEKVRHQESIAINLPRIMFERGLRVATMETLNEAGGMNKAVDTDKDSFPCDTQEEAREIGKMLGVNFQHRPTSDAPSELKINGRNPTSEKLLERMWGINKKTPVRMVPTIDNKWFVYWRPSLLVL
jgi:hypothetical protein